MSGWQESDKPDISPVFPSAEEHNILGGLADACAGVGYHLARVGVEDCFTESGPYKAIMEK